MEKKSVKLVNQDDRCEFEGQFCQECTGVNCPNEERETAEQDDQAPA